MKISLLLLCIPIIGFSQIQIGNDINGKAEGDVSGAGISLSSDGSIIAIGAPYNDENGIDSGQVRVYKNNDGNWIQLGADINGEAANDYSGWSLSLSSDGTFLAIGGSRNDGSALNSGHVRVYKFDGLKWNQIGLDIDGENEGDDFGTCVKLSSDGSIVAIGATANDGVTGELSGHVRVYENISGTWTQIGEDIDGESSNNFSGGSLSISGDGSIVAIGAIGNDGDYWNWSLSGHVRVYKNISGTWTQIGDDINSENAEDRFGGSVGISEDGSILAVGAYENDGIFGNWSGHVRIFENIGGSWIQIGDDIDGKADDKLGNSLSLSSNGNVLAVSALNSHVRLFKKTNDIWTEFFISNNDSFIEDFSGVTALSSNGNILALGSAGYNIGTGRARVFDLNLLLSSNDFVQKEFYLLRNPIIQGENLEIKLSEKLEFQKLNIYSNLGQFIDSTEKKIYNTGILQPAYYFAEVETINGKATKMFVVK